jgi:hypothetical protein
LLCGLPQCRHRAVHFDRFSKVLGTRISDLVAMKAAPQPDSQQQTEDEHRPQSVDFVVDNTHEIPAEPAKPPFAKDPKLDSCIIFLAECDLL